MLAVFLFNFIASSFINKASTSAACAAVGLVWSESRSRLHVGDDGMNGSICGDAGRSGGVTGWRIPFYSH